MRKGFDSGAKGPSQAMGGGKAGWQAIIVSGLARLGEQSSFLYNFTIFNDCPFWLK